MASGLAATGRVEPIRQVNPEGRNPTDGRNKLTRWPPFCKSANLLSGKVYVIVDNKGSTHSNGGPNQSWLEHDAEQVMLCDSQESIFAKP